MPSKKPLRPANRTASTKWIWEKGANKKPDLPKIIKEDMQDQEQIQQPAAEEERQKHYTFKAVAPDED